jgi:hypothetical protein
VSIEDRRKSPRPAATADDLASMLGVEVKRLKAIEVAARNLFTMSDHVLGTGWRAETLTTKGDPLNGAWLKLAEALGEET